MKKIFATILAAAMVASMSAVSFAAGYQDSGTPKNTSPKSIYDAIVTANKGKYDDKDGFPIDTTLVGPFGYKADDKNLTLASVEYGETAYFLLTEYYGTPGMSRFVTDSDTTNGLKVKGDWEEGNSLVNGMAITKKKVNSFGNYPDPDDKNAFTEDAKVVSQMKNTYGFESNKYYYMVALTVDKSTSTADADIIGTLTLSKSKKPKCDSIEFDVAINVDWEESYRKDSTNLVITGDPANDFYAETYYSLKFDCDEEIEMTFADDSTFTVDVSGQSKTLLYYDTDFNSKIAAKFPLAELNFWNGNGAKFNRTGKFFLAVGENSADYAQFLYQVNADGTLSAVPGAEYDDSDEGFYFSTRTLGSYVYSDMELDTTSKDTTDDSVVVTPVVPVKPVNPGTGARA